MHYVTSYEIRLEGSSSLELDIEFPEGSNNIYWKVKKLLLAILSSDESKSKVKTCFTKMKNIGQPFYYGAKKAWCNVHGEVGVI